MREKVVPAVFLMLVLLIGFPSSVGDFSAFADKDDNKKDKVEKAQEKAEKQKEKLKEKYEREIQKLKEKAEKKDEKLNEKYERELKKLEEKANRLDKDDHDDEHDDDHDDDHDDYITKFGSTVEIDYSSKTLVLCHIPPGNPDNAKSITIGTKAARAHIYNHGDTMGECSGNIELDLEEREYQLSKKQQKLEELRSKFEQKQIELAQKFSDKLEKMSAKYAEKEAKRAAKLLEKIESGEYYKDFIDEDTELRKFVLSFGEPNSGTLNADPIGQSESISPFSGSITLITSSSTDTRGTTKFKVDDCNLTSDSISYSCEYGKARTISTGTGVKDGLVIIATFESDSGKRTGMKLSISTDVDIKTLVEEDDPVTFTVHGPQSKITHQWFLSGEGTMHVEPDTDSTEESDDT